MNYPQVSAFCDGFKLLWQFQIVDKKIYSVTADDDKNENMNNININIDVEDDDDNDNEKVAAKTEHYYLTR